MKQKLVERLYIAIKKAEGRALVDGTRSEGQLQAEGSVLLSVCTAGLVF